MPNDQFFLKLARDESLKVKGKHKYGAVIVLEGDILAIDHNHVWEEMDPSAHAEVSAIRTAAKKLGHYNIDGATLYASHEPCVMCFSCAAWANIARVVFAVPADELSNDAYEFKGLSLQQLASKLQRKIIVEYEPIHD